MRVPGNIYFKQWQLLFATFRLQGICKRCSKNVKHKYELEIEYFAFFILPNSQQASAF